MNAEQIAGFGSNLSSASLGFTTWIGHGCLMVVLKQLKHPVVQRDSASTSALTVAEAGRAVFRALLSGRITARQERKAIFTLQRFTKRCQIVSVTEAILAHAGRPFPVEPIRTLDAIHLATAEAPGDAPALVSLTARDLRVRDNAIALDNAVE